MTRTKQPHIILIMTDQQRTDTIAELGAPWMHTPHMDRLVREGCALTNCFVTSPVCVASRASLFTGMYPHSTGVFNNFHPWEPTWVRSLADVGYHCVNIGKMHINPYDAPGGFHQRYVVENKDRALFLEEHDRAFHDEWDKALHARKLVKPTRFNRFANDPDGFRNGLGTFTWEIDEDMHPDMFVGDFALWWLEERKASSPLFLQIGFPGPHPPFDAVPRHLERYNAMKLPLPRVTEEELAAQPRSHRGVRHSMVHGNFDSLAWKESPPEDALLRMRRHYAANVSMIDEKLGEILEVLERKGYLDDAIVIFTSDHGEALGDHGHIQKWTMYDCVERVPLVFWSPSRIKASGQRNDSLVQLIDIAPTILDSAGVPVPPEWDARSLWPVLDEKQPKIRDVVYAELARCHIQTNSEHIVMRRDTDWKLVLHLGEDDGELYDLTRDPDEVRNLWTSPEHRELRERLVRETLEWSVGSSLNAKMAVPTRKPQQPMAL